MNTDQEIKKGRKEGAVQLASSGHHVKESNEEKKQLELASYDRGSCQRKRKEER